MEAVNTNAQIKALEIKIKSLEIENQKYSKFIEANKKEIEEYKILIQSLSGTKTANDYINNEINLRFKWRVSDVRKGLICELKNENKTIKKIRDNKWNCTAIGNKQLIKGIINKWKIQVNADFTDITAGIVPTNIDLNGQDNWAKGYVTNLSNFGKHNLGVYTPLCNIIAKKGEIVEIIVDLEKEKGELSYSLNGKKLGIFCDNINKNLDYVPFIDLCYVGTEVTLLE